MTKARCSPLWQPIPCPLSDIEGLESWLGDMAAQGLVPVTIGQNFARFRCSQPKAVRYRLNAKPTPETFLESAPAPRMARNAPWRRNAAGIMLPPWETFSCTPARIVMRRS